MCFGTNMYVEFGCYFALFVKSGKMYYLLSEQILDPLLLLSANAMRIYLASISRK